MILFDRSGLELPELAVYRERSDMRLMRLREPEPGVFIVESAKAVERAVSAGYEPLSFLGTREDLEGEGAGLLAMRPEVPAYCADQDVIRDLTGYPMTRGILAALDRRPGARALDLLRSQRETLRRIAVLEDVENPANVGAIIRSAAALGMDAVLLTSDCCDPLYRRSIRVSMGTVFQLPWAWFRRGEWPEKGMNLLRELGYTTAAMALKEDSVSLRSPELEGRERMAVILGNEGEGLRDQTIALCDYKVIIPMYHGVDSLNVAAASSVAFWQLGRRDG